MSFPPRYATLFDGGFIIKKLKECLRAFPTADHIEAVSEAIKVEPDVAKLELLRIYFYDAPPGKGLTDQPD